MQEQIISLLAKAIYLTENWDNDPTINGTQELYEALVCAVDAAKECWHTHDVMEEFGA